MNVFLLAPILGCMDEGVCGKMAEAVQARERVSPVKLSEPRCRLLGVQKMRGREREKVFEGIDYIGIHFI